MTTETAQNPAPTPAPNPAPTPEGTPPTQGQTGGQPPADAGNQPKSGAEGAPPAGGDLLDTGANPTPQGEPAGDLLSGDGNTQQEGVPDQYAFEAPEGFDQSLLDEQRMSAMMDVARENGLSQDQFQGIMSYWAERTQANVDEAVGQWNDRVQGWRDAARADKEIGGETFQSNIATALGVVEKFGDPELRGLLQSPSEQNPEGLAIGNHPAVLRFLHRIGKRLGDPALVQGDAQTKDDTTDAKLRRMYPSMFKDSA